MVGTFTAMSDKTLHNSFIYAKEFNIFRIFSRDWAWLQTGSGLGMGFIELLHIVTTNHYNHFTSSDTLQFARTHTWVLSTCFIFTSLLVTAFQRRTFPFLRVPELFPYLSYSNPRLTDWLADSGLVLCITYWYGPRRKQRFPLLLYPIVAMETCLFVKPLFSNGCLCLLCSSYLQQIRNRVKFVSLQCEWMKCPNFSWPQRDVTSLKFKKHFDK
jgi:hypothetical protein